MKILMFFSLMAVGISHGGGLFGEDRPASPKGPSPTDQVKPKDSDSGGPSVEKVSDDDTYRSLESLSKGLFFIESMYVEQDKVKSDSLVRHALEGIISHLDPHTQLMPPKAFQQLTIDTQGKFGGVGVVISVEDGKVLIVSVLAGTPADKGGVKPGDQIVAIDSQSIKSLSVDDAIGKMRGDPGATLHLAVERKGTKGPLQFKLIREVIAIRSVQQRPLDDTIVYARIQSFQEDSSKDLASALQQHQSKLKGLVLDLRDNPGGLLDQAVKVVDLFVESGIIVSTVGRDPAKVEREFAHKRGTYTGFPIVVLVNGGSASASEIVAGALQDHERAMIMGTQTFGKGSVQTVLSLPDGSGLKLTVARYYTPKDRSIQAKGITPDIVIEPTAASQQVQNSAAEKNLERPKKESDLRGHIESKDLSKQIDDLTLESTQKWDSEMQKDHQLVMAYTYLKGWSRIRVR